MEKHKRSMEIYLAIYGGSEPHSDIAVSINSLGNVHEELGELDKALENYEQSLHMSTAIHGDDRPHPDIAESLNNLGSAYARQGKLGIALEKHERSLEMYLAIHGHGKPAIAMSLSDIGRVYHKQKKLNQAAKFLEQSLEMLRTVFAQNTLHPLVSKVLCYLAEVYEAQGRKDEALAIRERNQQNNETKKRSDHGSESSASGNQGR